MMTHIWVPSPNCALSWFLLHFRIRSRMFGQVCVVRVTHPTVLQTALPRECNVGQARAPAVASTPARRFCATRPCTLCFLDHVPSAVWSFVRASARRIVRMYVEEVAGIMDNVTAGLYRPQPFLSTVKYAWNAFLSSQNGLCQVDSLTAPPANATQREATRSRALRGKDQTADGTWPS